jgi:hypothetical protein
MTLTNLFDAARERDAALSQVQANAGDFVERALDAIRVMPHGFCETGEGFRKLVERRGIKPHHHNAWGALINVAVKRGMLVATGEMAHMKGHKSHARRTPIYRVQRD